MIKVVGRAACGGEESRADPWIPFIVNWRFEERAGTLNLYVRGENGGYLEMRVDERCGCGRCKVWWLGVGRTRLHPGPDA